MDRRGADRCNQMPKKLILYRKTKSERRKMTRLHLLKADRLQIKAREIARRKERVVSSECSSRKRLITI
jgi:hypothetical protein